MPCISVCCCNHKYVFCLRTVQYQHKLQFKYLNIAVMRNLSYRWINFIFMIPSTKLFFPKILTAMTLGKANKHYLPFLCSAMWLPPSEQKVGTEDHMRLNVYIAGKGKNYISQHTYTKITCCVIIIGKLPFNNHMAIFNRKKWILTYVIKLNK